MPLHAQRMVTDRAVFAIGLSPDRHYLAPAFDLDYLGLGETATDREIRAVMDVDRRSVRIPDEIVS
jgi:hypothetical protein